MTNSEHSSTQNMEYEVEKIIDYRKVKKIDPKTNKTYYIKEYLIKWLGYNEQSWEPESNLENCQEMLNEFKKKLKKKHKNKNKKNIFKKTFWTYDIYSKKNNKTNLKEEDLNPKSCYKIQKMNKIAYEVDNNFSYSNINENKLNFEIDNDGSNDESQNIKQDNNTEQIEYNEIKDKKEETTEYIFGDSEKSEINENIDENNNQFNSLIKMPIFANILNKCSFSTESEFGPQFYDVINSGTKYNPKDKFKEEKEFIEKKRKRNDSFSSSYSKDIKEENMDNNKGNNSDNNNNKKFEFVEICEIKVPNKKDECINLYGKFKINGRIIEIHGKSDLTTFPRNEVFKCYENVIKHYFSGKKIIFK